MPRCNLCPVSCELNDGQLGYCKVRAGDASSEFGSRLLTYGHVSTASIGPIEQKPIFHFMPGASVLSVGSNGCNMACAYCQNFEISQIGKKAGKSMSPHDVVAMAKDRGAAGIAFTFSEPLMWYEYVRDTATAARVAGLHTILKTNGLCDRGRFLDIVSLMSAVNIDVKGGPRSYREVCGLEQDGILENVLENVGLAASVTHTELSTILIPGYEDELDDLFAKLCHLLPSPYGHRTPIHLLRFIPDFKMRLVPPTSFDDMESAKKKAKRHFRHVYLGYSGAKNQTTCDCGTVIVSRTGLELDRPIGWTRCPNCGSSHDIILA